MSASELLKSSERSALKNNQFVSRVSGKKTKSSKKRKSGWAAGFIVIILLLVAVLFSSGNIIPTTIYERLIEETDTQCADAVMSKNLAFQQALKEGNIPNDTTQLLNESGIKVGYVDNDGNFVEDNKSGVSSVLEMGNNIITADEFINRVKTDSILYEKINDATYKCAAYYYDETAIDVFQEIGTTRNNYNNNSSFEDVVSSLMGSGSNVNINSVLLEQKTQQNPDTGEAETYYEYVKDGEAASSKDAAMTFIDMVANKNTANNSSEATLNAADSLKVADTISKEQRSALFYTLFMENISKMKAGDGNESKLNEAMNYLYDKTENDVVNVQNGETEKVVGTALDSPSLYAILSGKKIDIETVEDYSSDRILKTVENQVGGNGSTAIAGTVASSTNKTKGLIGRFIDNVVAGASNAVLSLVEPTVSSSMVNNSYEDIKGVNAGETLVEGAVNVGKMLAKKSGATSGDATSVTDYARLNSAILAMEAEVDRANRSPFDITSKNTFLGSIVYKFAMASVRFSGFWSGVKTFSSTLNTAIATILPTSYADGQNGYLATFGDCETYATIGMVGTAQCSEITTFDISTLDDPFNDVGFIDFVNNNTVLDDSGVRKISEGSDLAKFILYNDERKTPLGVIDGGILSSLNKDSNSIPFLSDVTEMIETFLVSSEQDRRMATGEAFVNSSENPDWQTYKYAQRYVSLARATAALKQYSSDETAYNNLKFFEGNESPVVAFIKQHNALANK